MTQSQQFLIDEANFAGAPLAVTNEHGIVPVSRATSSDAKPLTVEQFVAKRGVEKPRVMPIGEYMDFKHQWQSETFLSDPALEVSGAWFQYQLEVLPPRDFERVDGIVRFNMCEFITGTITTQYANRGQLFLARNVDVSDRDTWITPAEFDLIEVAGQGGAA